MWKYFTLKRLQYYFSSYYFGVTELNSELDLISKMNKK